MHLACSVIISADDILKYFFFFSPKKKEFDLSCKQSSSEQIVSLGKDMISMSSAEIAKRVVKVKDARQQYERCKELPITINVNT